MTVPDWICPTERMQVSIMPSEPSPPRPSLAERQQELLQRSALLRFELTEQGRALRASLALADQGYIGWQWLKAHPLRSLAALLLLSMRRSRQLLRWLPRLWWGWNLLKRVLKTRRGE